MDDVEAEEAEDLMETADVVRRLYLLLHLFTRLWIDCKRCVHFFRLSILTLHFYVGMFLD